VGIFGVLLWGKYQLALIRYFDADELAYLHWAHNVFIGVRPYYDFLSNVPTIFWYVLAPLYFFVDGANILSVSRLFGFILQVGIAVSLIALGKAWRGNWVGIVAAGIFLFLPLPSDKLLEVRPDNLAILLALIGMVIHVRTLRDQSKIMGWFMAGVFYGLSLIVLPKTVPQVAVAIGVTVYWWSERKMARLASLWRFVMGMVAPLFGFVGLHLIQARSIHEVNMLMYTLTKFPFEVNRIAEQFMMQPDLFFYPNSVYYGASGWTTALFVNHTIWFIGLLAGIIRLFTPFIPRGRKGAPVELLIAGTTIAYIVSFVWIFTFRHAQYLIPSAIFVALFAADAALYLWNWSGKNRLSRGAMIGLLLILIIWLPQVYISVNAPKLSWTNAEDKRLLVYALSTISKDAYVLDLVGSTIYFKDPYVVCCVPFGQWEPYLSRPLPNLPEALSRTHTKYIYQGKLDRVTTLQRDDRAYIFTHYIPANGNSSLLIRKD